MAPPRGDVDPRRPNPGVRFGQRFLARLERCAARLVAAERRREGEGAAKLAGGGLEFDRHRPYRAGDDLRHLDWGLLARLDRPYVRVAHRESSEAWVVLLDSSASMAVGEPGKLQAAAELAAAFVSLGLAHGASVRLVAHGARGRVERTFARRAQLGEALATLSALEAAGTAGLGALLAEARPGDAARVVAIGDLLDLEPRALLAWRGPRRELWALQVLADHELAPEPGGARRWLDPESDGAVEVAVDAAAVARYEARLGKLLEGWRAAAGRHGFRHAAHASRVPFEDVLRELLGG